VGIVVRSFVRIVEIGNKALQVGAQLRIDGSDRIRPAPWRGTADPA
jgi:hypothetical protein